MPRGALGSPPRAADGRAATVSQGMAFGFVNLAWAVGQTAGAAGGARLAELAGDPVPYLVLAGVCAVTFAALARSA
jgi:hypothetical protein